MRSIDKFEQVIGNVKEMSAHHYDETLPLADMRFHSLNRMLISGKEVQVLPSAQRLFANRLRVPHSYLVRCPGDLQAENLNHWLREEKEIGRAHV